jgi:5-methyltetrahydrofolate--homocysteine methyltransferase
MRLPLLIGGATTSKVHTAIRIDPAYEGPVIHVLDASRAVGVASSLVSTTQREPFIATTAEDYDKIRISRERSGHSELATIDEARANGLAYDPSGKVGAPQYPGLHHFGEWPLKDLKSSIDWTPFFRAWNWPEPIPRSLRGSDRRRKRPEPVQRCPGDARPDHCRTVGYAKGTVGLWRCRREGDDVLILAGNDWTRVLPSPAGEEA